jgi:hypothetical protein
VVAMKRFGLRKHKVNDNAFAMVPRSRPLTADISDLRSSKPLPLWQPGPTVLLKPARHIDLVINGKHNAIMIRHRT